MTRHSFTLFEILVVTVLIVLITALVAPRLAMSSKTILVESNLTEIRQAIAETSMRACATGQSLTLTLEPETSIFTVSQASELSNNYWNPGRSANQDNQPGLALIEVKPSYQLSKNIEWLLGETNIGLDEAAEFSFFPDGQASGQPVRFAIMNRQFQLEVDRLTGNPVILELE